MAEHGNAAAMRLCDELIQAAYDADIFSPYDLAQRVRKIKDAIGPSPQGNASALREALIQCELFIGNVSRHAHPTLNPGDKCTACDGVDELRGMVVAALSAPPRNCDNYETPDEAWYEYAKTHSGTSDRSWKSLILFARWLFAPEGGKREN